MGTGNHGFFFAEVVTSAKKTTKRPGRRITTASWKKVPEKGTPQTAKGRKIPSNKIYTYFLGGKIGIFLKSRTVRFLYKNTHRKLICMFRGRLKSTELQFYQISPWGVWERSFQNPHLKFLGQHFCEKSPELRRLLGFGGRDRWFDPPQHRTQVSTATLRGLVSTYVTRAA